MTKSRPPYEVSFATLFEKAPHAAVVLDLGLTILAVNEAGQRLFGMEPAQLIGTPLFDVLPNAIDSHTGWQERLRHSYTQVLLTGSQRSMLLCPRDGATVESKPAAAPPADVSPAPYTPAAGTIWHVCHVPMRDKQGALVAIATYALLLEAREIASAQVFGFVTAPDAPAPLRTPPAASIAIAGNDTMTVRPTTVSARAVLSPATPVLTPAAENAATGTSADKTIGAATATAGLRILMVEDNDDLRMVNVDQLEMLGHQVTSTADAEQALRHLETSTFDLLFTDLTLPKMTGAELARLVLQQHHPMQVVITSGYGRAMANAQSLDALFLPKPYRFADLQEVLRQARLRRDS